MYLVVQFGDSLCQLLEIFFGLSAVDLYQVWHGGF
jgi:hypothetical protein